MKSCSLRISGVLVVVALLGCDPGTGTGTVLQPVGTLSCPAGQVPWDFYRFRNGLDDESLRQLGPDAGTGDPLVGEPNYFQLQKAVCHNRKTDKDTDITEAMRPFCTGRRAKCDSDSRAYSTMIARADTCWNAPPATLTYTCFEDGQVITTSEPWTAKCAQHPIQRTSCVPENCYGHTRRDRFLQCVPDLIKPVEFKNTLVVNMDVIERPLRDPARDSPDAYSTRSSGDVSVITLDDDQVYRFKGSIDVDSGPAPRQLLTLWIKSTVPRPGATAPSLDIFRCFLGRIDLRKYEPRTKSGGGSTVEFDEIFRIPKECQDGGNFANVLKTAWLANGLASDGGFPSSAPRTTLMASYDLEANAIVASGSTAVEATCVPRPVDFFFNYQTNVHNSYDYYSQLTIPVVHRQRSPSQQPLIEFNRVPSNLVATTVVVVPLLQYKVNKAGRARGSIDANLVVAMSGPDTEKWAQFLHKKTEYGLEARYGAAYPRPPSPDFRQFSSLGRQLSLDTWAPGKEETATALVPVPDVTALDANGEVRVDASGLVRLPPEALAVHFDGELSEMGAGATLSIKINNALRTALFNPNAKYPLRPGETRNYVLQVCAEAKVREDFQVFTRRFGPWSAETQTLTYTDRIQVIHEAVAPAINELNPSYPGTTAVFLQDGDATNLKTARNNCARSAVFSIIGENIVTPLPEVDLGDGDASDLNPTASGDPDRLSGTFHSDTTQDCVGSRCETTSEQSFGGSTSPVNSTVLSIVNEQTEDDTTNQFSTSFKMFGFDVFESLENGGVGPVETVITISPKYEEIAKAFGKPYPAFKIEGGRVAAGVNGLSVGFEYKIPLRFGPIQGDLIFGVSAGAGLNAEVFHSYNPKVATSCATIIPDGGSVIDGCPDPMVEMPALPFREARDLCYFLGGRLAEPRSDAIESSMRQKIAASEQVWVGAQVGNEYRENTDCAVNWNSSVCADQHKTYLRWLSDAENFRRSVSFGDFAAFGASPVTSLSGTALTTEALTARKPVDSAVTLQGSTFRVKPMADSYRSLCKRPLITQGTSHEVGIKLNLACGAGFSVAFCTPSDEIGICLEGSFNIIEAKLTPGVSVTHTALSNNAGAKASQTKFGAKVTWSVNLLSGALEVKLVTPFFDLSYTLIEYEGFKVGEGTLAEFEYDFKDFPVGF